LGPEEQLYLEELKERHRLAPERNSVEYTKFVIEYQIENLREEIADRVIIYDKEEEKLLHNESLKLNEQLRNEKFQKLRHYKN